MTDIPIYPGVHMLKEGLYAVDMGAFIKDILSNQWTESHTDSEAPEVNFAEDTKTKRFRQADQIILYMMNDSEDPILLMGYNRENQVIGMSLEFLCTGERDHATKVVAEAKRIIQANRKDPLGAPGSTHITGRMYLKWGIRSTGWSRTSTNFYRKTVDIEAEWKFKEMHV